MSRGYEPVTGYFADAPGGGLGYSTPSRSGQTDEGGRFTYLQGEAVRFSLGDLPIGWARTAPQVTAAHLGPAAPPEGPSSLKAPFVTNVARLLQTLRDVPSPTAKKAVRRASETGNLDFTRAEADFARQTALQSLLDVIGRPLVTGPAARNRLRRALTGIQKLSDVRVPMRDGSYLLADVFLPAEPGQYPAVLRMSVYGRAFGMGTICSQSDQDRSDEAEDNWFEDRPKGLAPLVRYAENAVSANSTDWVPRGYVLVRLDCRGVGPTPGQLAPFSAQEAQDYYDAIEWAAGQAWCNGSVGLLGASYAATNQWNVAALAPPSLRAMIPWASDADGYRDLAYPGGIFQEGYRRAWWANVISLQCQAPEVDFVDELRRHPHDDPAFYGPRSPGPVSADLDKISVPILTAVSQTAALHSRAGFEAVTVGGGHRQVVVVAENYFYFLYRECLDIQFRFFDWFLKGEGDGPPGPPVRLMMRSGAGEYHWRDEHSWPVPGTQLLPWYLDAGAASPAIVSAGPEPAYELRSAPPAQEGTATYTADVEGRDDRESSGVRFVGPPLDDDVHLAGHFRAELWVASTSIDMDVFVSLRVADPEGNEVRYPVGDRTALSPVTWGCLKVSHRQTDPARSEVRPWHTHLESDVRLLESPADVVRIDVELMPATAVVRSGQRLIVEVQPVEGRGGYRGADGRQAFRAYDRSYHAGAENFVHTGGDRPSRIWLPVVPPPGRPAC